MYHEVSNIALNFGKSCGTYRASLVTQMVESACIAEDLGLIPGLGRSPGEGNGNPLQYSCLGNLMDRGAWWATQPMGSQVSDMS